MKWYWRKKHSAKHQNYQTGCIWAILRTFRSQRSRPVKRLLSIRTYGVEASASIGSGLSVTISDQKTGGLYSSVDNIAEASSAVNILGKCILDIQDEKKQESVGVSDVNPDQEPVKIIASDEIARNNQQQGLSALERRNLAEGQKHKSRTAKVVQNPQPEYERPPKCEKEDPTCHAKFVERFTGTTDQVPPEPLESLKFESKEVHDLEKAMIDLISKKFDESACISKDVGIHNAKEITDALQMLNSNKELFVKLLHDPNSLLFKHVEGLKNAVRKNVKKPSKVKHKVYDRDAMADQGKRSGTLSKIVVLEPNSPTNEKNVLASARSSREECYSLEKQDRKNLASYFSIEEFRRKLRSAAYVKGEQHNFINDEILYWSSYTSQFSEGFGSAARTHHDSMENFTIRRSESWKENKWISHRVIVDELSSPRGSKYIENNNSACSGPLLLPRKSDTSEIKGKLSEFWTSKDATESSAHRSSRRTLGKLLSIPDYDLLSPRFCPHGDTSNEIQLSLSCEHHEMGSSSCYPSENNIEYNRSLREDSEFKTPLIAKEPSSSSSSSSSSIQGNAASTKIEDTINVAIFPNSEQGLFNEATEIPNDYWYTEPASIAKKAVSMMGISVLPIPEIKMQPVDPFDLLLPSSIEQMECSVTSIVVEEPTLESPVDKIVSPQSPPLFCHIPYESVQSEIGCEKPQKPSPMSVLELASSDANYSPGVCSSPQEVDAVFKSQKLHFEVMEDSEIMGDSSSSRYDGITSTTKDSKMEDCKLQLKETDIEYIRLLLEASNLTSIKALDERWDSCSQPLHDSMFLFINPPNEVSVDRLLLFDCVNEALTEISEQYSTYDNLIPCTRHCLRPFLPNNRLIDKVWEHVNLQLPLHSNTLDEYIKRDLANDGKWMELRMDIQCIAEVIELSLLEELIQDTVMVVSN